MNRSGNWRSQLTGTMLGQLQLATYAAVLLGFTGATTTGLWLSERSRLQVSEAELLATAESLADDLRAEGASNEAVILRELQDQLNGRKNMEEMQKVFVCWKRGNCQINVLKCSNIYSCYFYHHIFNLGNKLSSF